ncbi:Tom37 C-terminal domain-containing protein [Exophiala viscosa]|uniref:Tom37 C-terminal domain-containing protein n=1 Tax=Exophiala viscosa TaxID=2486360 RepID=UPI00219FE633|nr:Tom37 C-terminal domain-containing protein [Exophiala viscosa]
MVLELHIWGPAFDLPSIDAQCLATTLYLQQCVPQDGWVLIPSSEPRVSPLGELPALRNGDTWVAGFGTIVSYLRDTSDGKWDLDKNLDESQRADSAAFSSFIESRGQPLLDLSLYVSSDNYLSCTRQALADILTWPSSWTIPHQLRDKAKTRSEHLGLSSLDVDTAQEDKKENVGLAAHIPKSLRKPRETVSGLLGRNAQNTRFRLDAVTSDFLEPMEEALAEKNHFLGETVTSLDCLAAGYLALMARPDLPQGWLREALRTKYSRLHRWTELQIEASLGTHIDADKALGRKKGLDSRKPVLPWQVPGDKSLGQLCYAIIDGCVSAFPVIGLTYTVSEVKGDHASSDGRYRRKQLRLTRLQHRRDLYVEILASTCAVTGLVGWLWYKGMLQLPRRTPKGRTFGEAGALFGLA